MQTRFPVVALAVSGLLVVAGVWLALTPKESPRPKVPTATGADLMGYEFDDPLELESLPVNDVETSEPVNAKLTTPPIAPPIVNDPATGKVWLRIIDADTNRPLAKKSVSLLPVGYAATNEWRYLTEEPRPAPRFTDADGLLALSVSTETAEECDVLFDVPNNEISFLLLPVPRGWYPCEDVYELTQRLFDLSDEPTTEPLTLWVRRNASVTVVARDRWGVPIHDAKLKVDLLIDDSAPGMWIETFCTPDYAEWFEDWQTDTNELRAELQTAQMRCTVNGAFMPDDDYDAEYWQDNEFTTTSNSGVAEYLDVPCISVGAVAWHPLYGTATATLKLESGRNSLDVFFTEPPCAELRVRVNSLPASDDPEDEVGIGLKRSGPYGVSEFLQEASVWAGQYWELPAGGSTWEAVFTGVPPGWWHVGLNGIHDTEAGANVELVSGESKTIQLYIGDNAQAYWTPVIRSGGEQLAEASFFLLGGMESERDEWTVVRGEEGFESEAIGLAPGVWTVWVPTLPPFTFTLKPGEKRRDIFDLKTLSVSFTLELDLALYLGNPKEGAQLNLYPVGAFEDAREHLYAMDAQLREADPDYDILKAGVPSIWSVPVGDYEWTLSGEDRDLSGRISFTATGPTSVVFGTDSLPGYAVLVVDLVGFDADNPPDLWIDNSSTGDFAVMQPDEEYARGPMVVFPDLLELNSDETVQVERVQVSAERQLFFAPPGTMILEVSGDGLSGQRVVTFPGKLTLRPNQFGLTKVQFVTTREAAEQEANGEEPAGDSNVEEIEYAIETYSEGGVYERVYDEEWEAPPGKVKLRVQRSIYFMDGSVSVGIAEFQIELKAKPLMVELARQQYVALASLDLVFKGRGSPEQATDAWWFSKEGPSAPRLYELNGITGTPRHVELDRLSQYMPQGRLEFSCRGLALPPGRYRLVPWPGASAKYVQEFTLKSGAHTTITTQGG